MKTILFVAMSDSTHTARWINQIAGQGWDLHLLPSRDIGEAHPQLNNITIYHTFYTKCRQNVDHKPTAKNCGIYIPLNPRGIVSTFLSLFSVFMERYFPDYRVRKLRRLIKRLKPDIIHSLEFQHAGYLTLQALHKEHADSLLNEFWRLIKSKASHEKEMPSFPIAKTRIVGSTSRWIATNWGSDIYLFGRLSAHREKIRQVVENCDYYSCECHRDVGLAKFFGLKGKVLPVFPNTGGFDLEKVSRLRLHGRTSERRVIMLKGYQGWAYRALVGLRALERCADILKGYTVAIYLGFTGEVKIAAELFSHSTGVPVEMIPNTSHEEILRYHGRARISIGLSISDAISTSFLEALVMGSFPIQSWTACADEWIENGKTGILVPPEDPDVIEKAIRHALTDDDLVNQAAEENWKTAIERLDQSKLKPKAVELYNTVAKEKGIGK